MPTNEIRPVIRVRKSAVEVIDQPPPQESWRGYGSIPGETPDEFHDRMYEIPALEACIYELDFALRTAA